jgi:TonB family protein
MNLLHYHLKISLLLIAVLICTDCVYYNAFFMARQKFSDAEKSQRDNRENQQANGQSNNPGDIGRMGQPGQINHMGNGQQPNDNTNPSLVTQQERSLYNDAKDKAEQVLKDHPNSKWADDAIWLIGKSYFNMGDYLLAEKRFKELVTNHPDSKYADDSYYYMGLCDINLGHDDQALSAFSSIEKAPKQSPYLEDVVFAKAMMELTGDNQAEALNIFGQYLQQFPHGDSAALAVFYIGQCKENLKDYFGAYQAYIKVEKYKPSKNLYFEARLAAATAALATDSVSIGMKILENLGKDQRYFSKSGEIHLRTAEGYHLQNNIDKAIELYKEVTTQNPQTNESAEAYYQLGLIYQNTKFDFTAAKEAFTKAQSESQNTQIRNMALQKSAQIAKLESYKLQLQQADSLKNIMALESLGDQSEPPGLQLKSPGADSTDTTRAIINNDSTKTAGIDTSLIQPNPIKTRNIAVDSSISAIGLDTLAEAAVKSNKIAADTLIGDSSALIALHDTLAVRHIPGLDSAQFASMSPAEKMKMLFGKSEESDSLPGIIPAKGASRDTITQPAVELPKNAPDSLKQQSSRVNQDSIRQSIIQNALETRYLLSELYAYELNRPDSAISEYILIADDYPKSTLAAKSLLAAAQLELNTGDTITAQTYLNRLISEYPKSPQAAQAAGILSLPFDISNNAVGLYAMAESLADQANNPDSAVTVYKYIATNFPDLAPKASYAIAWTLDVVKGVEDSSAFYAYNAVMKNYPQTEFAEASKERLGLGAKQAPRQQTDRIKTQPAEEQNPDSTADSVLVQGQGFPVAPPVKVDGQFIYPEALLSQNIHGKVIFKIRLDITGKVQEYEIIGPSGQLAIDSSATAALLRTKFDVSALDLAALDGYFQFSIAFKRPKLDLFNDPYSQQHNLGRP